MKDFYSAKKVNVKCTNSHTTSQTVTLMARK